MLEFRLAMHSIGRNIRWMGMLLAALCLWVPGPATRAQTLAMFAMLGVATVYNISTYYIPWRRLEEGARAHLVVIPFIVADCLCIAIWVYLTGQIESSFFVVYLLLVLWMAAYPGLHGSRYMWTLVLWSYALAVFYGTQVTPQLIYHFAMRSLTFALVAWLVYRISQELFSARETLENAIRELSDGLVIFDSRRRVVLVNPRAEELLGVSEAHSLGRKIPVDGATPELAPLAELLSRTSVEVEPLEEKEGIRVHELAQEEEGRILRVISAPYVDAEGQPLGEMKVLHDVTDLKALDRLRSDFVSAVGHDLRSPLSTISLALNSAGKSLTEAPPNVVKMLSVASEETKRLGRMTEELLLIARLEAGQLVIRRREVNLASQIEAAVAAIQNRADSFGLTLIVQATDSLPTVYVDPDCLARVLHNLIDNAFQHTEERGHVVLQARLADDEPGMVEVAITDTGEGIPEEELATIFDRFVRHGDRLTIKTRGAGLGLSICRELITRHGGRLWADSRRGVGTTFHFTLPLYSGQPDESVEEAAGRSPSRARGPSDSENG